MSTQLIEHLQALGKHTPVCPRCKRKETVALKSLLPTPIIWTCFSCKIDFEEMAQ